MPPIDDGIQYRTDALQAIAICDSTVPVAQRNPELFYPSTITLLELRVDRFNNYVNVGRSPRNIKEFVARVIGGTDCGSDGEDRCVFSSNVNSHSHP